MSGDEQELDHNGLPLPQSGFVYDGGVLRSPPLPEKAGERAITPPKVLEQDKALYPIVEEAVFFLEPDPDVSPPPSLPDTSEKTGSVLPSSEAGKLNTSGERANVVQFNVKIGPDGNPVIDPETGDCIIEVTKVYEPQSLEQVSKGLTSAGFQPQEVVFFEVNLGHDMLSGKSVSCPELAGINVRAEISGEEEKHITLTVDPFSAIRQHSLFARFVDGYAQTDAGKEKLQIAENLLERIKSRFAKNVLYHDDEDDFFGYALRPKLSITLPYEEKAFDGLCTEIKSFQSSLHGRYRDQRIEEWAGRIVKEKEIVHSSVGVSLERIQYEVAAFFVSSALFRNTLSEKQMRQLADAIRFESLSPCEPRRMAFFKKGKQENNTEYGKRILNGILSTSGLQNDAVSRNSQEYRNLAANLASVLAEFQVSRSYFPE